MTDFQVTTMKKIGSLCVNFISTKTRIIFISQCIQPW